MENLEIRELSEEIDEKIKTLQEFLYSYKNGYSLKNPKVVIPMISGLGIDIYGMINTDYFFIKVLAAIAFLGMSVRNSVKSKYELYESTIQEKYLELHEEIRNQESFQLFLKEYREFVSDYVKLLNDIGIIKPTDTAFFYRLCLKDGYFSIDRTNSFQFPKNNEVCLPPEILGAKVTTSSSICRNNASFLTDVLNTKNVPSINVFVKLSRLKIEIFPSFLDRHYKLSYNHQITAFIEDNKLRTYDPTNDLNFNLSELKIKGETIEIGREIYTKVNALIYSDTCYEKEQEERKKLKTYEKANISEKEWREKRREVREKYQSAKSDLEDFWHEQKEKIEFLSKGYEEISISKNQKVKML